MGSVITYRSSHYRTIEDSTEQGKRVLTRQVVVDGEAHVEVVDGLDWRKLRDGERFRVAPVPLAQVGSWVA